MPHSWMSGPFPNDPAPAGPPPHNPNRGIPDEKIDRLLGLAEAEKNRWKNRATAYAKITANGAGTEAVSELLEHLGHFTGVGTVLSSVKHAAAAESTQEHL